MNIKCHINPDKMVVCNFNTQLLFIDRSFKLTIRIKLHHSSNEHNRYLLIFIFNRIRIHICISYFAVAVIKKKKNL